MLCCFPTAFWRLTASWKGLFRTFNSGQRSFGCVVDWRAEELSYTTLWLREGWIFFKQTSVSACLVFVVRVLAAVPYKAFACCDLVLCLLLAFLWVGCFAMASFKYVRVSVCNNFIDLKHNEHCGPFLPSFLSGTKDRLCCAFRQWQWLWCMLVGLPSDLPLAGSIIITLMPYYEEQYRCIWMAQWWATSPHSKANGLNV